MDEPEKENTPLSPEALRDAVEKGIEHWLDRKFEKLGKWFFGIICSIGISYLIYHFLKDNGWQPADFIKHD